MYSINKEKKKSKKKVEYDFVNIEGFFLPTKNKAFKISGQTVREIKIIDKGLAQPVVSRKVQKLYSKLILLLTDLLVSSDGDDGEAFREALNQIERFRQEIKNKYRAYLTKKELEHMAKQLSIIQKEAKTKLDELAYNYQQSLQSGKGR